MTSYSQGSNQDVATGGGGTKTFLSEKSMHRADALTKLMHLKRVTKGVLGKILHILRTFRKNYIAKIWKPLEKIN